MVLILTRLLQNVMGELLIKHCVRDNCDTALNLMSKDLDTLVK